MFVRIVASEGPAPEEKLADVELVFEEGLLSGMKLVGFSVWRSRRRALPVVTFPSRAFQVNGERRAYALLRPDAPGGSQEVLRAFILQAYMDYERHHPQLVAGPVPNEATDAARETAVNGAEAVEGVVQVEAAGDAPPEGAVGPERSAGEQERVEALPLAPLVNVPVLADHRQ